ncbi:molybdopterin molybdotransferase MoeA [Actinotalea sp. M2MS4P-6]|uniref:molybdopterin molybdotransferase MoeA n=1 Tax=Actinotalea sp. M2MS4P-6 TaxID=2983762 RepID=UPI0021E392AB|nr:gephyrin-like molybdotransferase Glp [Actinotalea sp. M2MS4P-6]MCV2393784.1 molybdopterin molybdotransferase MoeA [Actinotalea sp. M2MS4P-6]
MRSVTDHRAVVLSLVAGTPVVDVPVSDAAGLVLAADVTAGEPRPAWDSSSMDGYAVRSADLAAASAAAPVSLRVVAEVAAGSARTPVVDPGTAVRIMTGAPLPPGADSVVRQEDTDRGAPVVGIRHAAVAGDFVRHRGDDVAAGDMVLERGLELGARHLAAAVAAGVGTLRAHRRPRLAVVSTGAELVPPGEPLRRGQIHDSNSVLLAAQLRSAGADVPHVAVVPDDVEALRAVLDRLDGEVDLVVTTGGASVGDHDVVKLALAPGVEFVEVAMQPGKPQGAGRLPGGTPVLCLPGNPVSAFVGVEVLVRPVVRRLRGLTDRDRPTEPAVVLDGWRTPPGRAQYMPVALGTEAGRTTARRASAGGSASHLVAGLARADGLAVVPADVAEVRAGQTVPVMRTDG